QIAELDPTDNFNRANEDPIGGNWTLMTDSGNVRIVSNEIAGPSANGEGAVYYNAATPDNDQRSQAVLRAPLSGFDAAYGPAVRCSTTARTRYEAVALSNDRINLVKWVAGTQTTIEQIFTALAAGDTIKIEAEGSTLRVYKNGVQVHSEGDASIASGRWGMRLVHNTSRLDDWEGANLSAAGITGSIAATLPRATTSIAGNNRITGSISATLSGLTAALQSTNRITATLAAQVGALVSQLEATNRITGTIAAELPRLIAAFRSAGGSLAFPHLMRRLLALVDEE
ncbi:MAG TPA: hypothetical protein VEA41_10405, partial [Salinarimonas sp.]|nr:hypothetical protein [Salinarimonas sp.]